MVLYYSNQCPYTDKYAPIIKDIAERHGTTVTLHKIETTEQAQNVPAPFTTYSFFYNGDFVRFLQKRSLRSFWTSTGF